MQKLSSDAQRIVDAGLKAAKHAADNPAQAASDAVRHEVGLLGLNYPGEGKRRIIDNLMEIAQLHVRQQLS